MIKGSRGLYGLALLIFLLKLNVLEIVGEGAHERLSTWMFGSSKQVLRSKRWLGKFEENAIDIACPYLYFLHTYISIEILGMLCQNSFTIRIPTKGHDSPQRKESIACWSFKVLKVFLLSGYKEMHCSHTLILYFQDFL